MKKLNYLLLFTVVIIASCQAKEAKMTANNSTAFLPNPIEDDWSKWLVGTWEGSGESEAGKGKARIQIELGLNGQFLIMKGEADILEISAEQKKYLKETLHATDDEIKRFQSSSFKSLEVHTIDPKTGEIVGYMFDSLRCIATGRGKREGDKEIMNWEWFGTGKGTSIRTTEKVSEDKLIATEKYTIPDGSTMEDKGEMTRKK